MDLNSLFSVFEKSSVWGHSLPYSTGSILPQLRLQASSALRELLDHALLRCLQRHPLLLGKRRNPELGSQQLSS